MLDLPQSKEMIVAVPQAMQRYFYELVAGASCVIIATITALYMLVQVLEKGGPEWLRLFYFLVIALSLLLLIVGFKIVIACQQDRYLATPHAGKEWRMDPVSLTLSLALLEGKERAVVRRFKTGALRLEWQDITKIVQVESKPPLLRFHIENHEDTLGFDAVVTVRSDWIAAQRPAIFAFMQRQGVKLE